MYAHLRSYTHTTNEYEFKLFDEDGDHEANLWVTHRVDQTDITLELTDAEHNTPDERMEYMLLHGTIIMQAISQAQKD